MITVHSLIVYPQDLILIIKAPVLTVEFSYVRVLLEVSWL